MDTIKSVSQDYTETEGDSTHGIYDANDFSSAVTGEEDSEMTYQEAFPSHFRKEIKHGSKHIV